MRGYIAGPMRGHERWNFPAFDECRDRGKALGHDMVSPADMDRALGFDEFDPILPAWFDYREALRRDLIELLICDAIVMLPGWAVMTSMLWLLP